MDYEQAKADALKLGPEVGEVYECIENQARCRIEYVGPVHSLDPGWWVEIQAPWGDGSVIYFTFAQWDMELKKGHFKRIQ